MIEFVRKFLFLVNALLICMMVSLFVSANQNEVTSELQEKPAEKFSVVDENQEKVVISIINFGRSNPFKPYVPKKGKKDETDLYNIPYPPTLPDEVKQDYEILTKSVVNGILYDPDSRSVAIINVEDKDYMVHVGDKVKGIEIDSIEKTKVCLRYGANTYVVGVGEVIEGDVFYDEVERKQKVFAEKEYRLPGLELEAR